MPKQLRTYFNSLANTTFKENAVIRCPVESVIAAASIKSNLDKKQLFDSLENLASIPQLDKNIFTTGPLTKNFEEYIISWPSLFIFAFDGISLETCLEHMKNFYSTHQIFPNRMPRAIVVNRKYIIANLTVPVLVKNDGPFDRTPFAHLVCPTKPDSKQHHQLFDAFQLGHMCFLKTKATPFETLKKAFNFPSA